MSDDKSAQNRHRTLMISSSVLVVVLLFYLAFFHYSKARHFIFGIGHRITADNLPHLMSAIAWPSAVVLSVVILRVTLRNLIDRIESASVGGNQIATINLATGNETNASRAPVVEKPPTIEGVPFETRIRDNVANTYWVGADLMNLFDTVLRCTRRDEMLPLFRQVNHHLKVLRLKETPLYERFQRLHEDAEKSLDSDWTQSHRIEVVREIHSIVVALGHLIENTQPNFSGDAKTSDNL